MYFRKNLINGALESRNIEFPYNKNWEIISEEEYNTLLEEMMKDLEEAEETEGV